jgi:dipeptidyl aminopeptidase/acylaminoacyl peptidase
MRKLHAWCCVAGITLVLCAATIGVAERQPLTLDALTKVSRLTDVAASPDGEKIAFVSNHSGDSKIWLIAAKGGEPKLLTTGNEASESSPQWSPAGDEIAYLAAKAGELDIYVVSAKGGAPVQLTGDKSQKHAIRWSPDGKQIAYISDRDNYQDIYAVETAVGKTPRKLTEETNEWDEVRWAPAWSPDSKEIAYVSSKSDYFADDLWLLKLDGSSPEKLTSTITVMTDPQWSADGKYIAMNGVERQEFWFDDASNIYLMEMPEHKLRKLKMDQYVTDLNGMIHMDWGPDSRTLYFRYSVHGDSNIWAVNVEGNGVATQVTNGSGVVHSLSVAPKGNYIAMVRATQTDPGDLSVVPLIGGEERQLTHWATEFDGVEAPVRIGYRSTDGLFIPGYLYKPKMEAGKKYPAVVSVHGGGNNAFANGFHGLDQYLASKGYIVLAIEYRGSSGYGRQFQLESWGKWASEQGWDAVAASDYLRSLDYCSGKVGIYGGSYGGIMTMAALTRDSSKFQAAAPFYGIYDWTNAYKDGDRLMRFWVVMGMKGFKPEENPEIYRMNSTVNFVDKITTPMLIEHGKLDRRAPFPQSTELIAALEKNHKTYEYFTFPDEQHGIRKPENYVAAYTRMEKWFDKYLKQPVVARNDTGGGQ